MNFLKPGKGERRRRSLVDQHGDAGTNAGDIGIDAKWGSAVFVDMGVGIDQAWQHKFAGHVDRLDAFGGNARFQRSDLAVLGREIHDFVDALPGIDHPAAAQDQVVG